MFVFLLSTSSHSRLDLANFSDEEEEEVSDGDGDSGVDEMEDPSQCLFGEEKEDEDEGATVDLAGACPEG